MDKLKPEDYIYDRYGERIRIFVSDGKVEKELGKEVFVSLRKNKIIAIKLLINYLLNNGVIDLIKIKNFPMDLRISFIKKKLGKIKIIKVHYKNSIIKLRYNPFDISLLREIFIDDQYNAKKNLRNKIIIDGGANSGMFSLYAALNGAKKVYSFEPIPETYQILVNNIKINNLENKIIPINKALGEANKEGCISYSLIGDVAATLLKNDRGKTAKIKIITLDDFVKQNKIPRVDFIKMDVEGYEENVLLGAKETIKKWKPVLSFSAYHLPMDKERLPKIVKSIRPDYKIKLNYYDQENFYCW